MLTFNGFHLMVIFLGSFSLLYMRLLFNFAALRKIKRIVISDMRAVTLSLLVLLSLVLLSTQGASSINQETQQSKSTFIGWMIDIDSLTSSDYKVVKKSDAKAEFEQFSKRLAYMESRNNPKVVNRFGYMGLYQFNIQSLKACGITGITPRKFKANPACFPISLQNKALKTYTKLNFLYLQGYIEAYRGKVVKGVKLTDIGILAGAHLVGAGGAAAFLKSGGVYNPKDGNGVTFLEYTKKFSDLNSPMTKFLING